MMLYVQEEIPRLKEMREKALYIAETAGQSKKIIAPVPRFDRLPSFVKHYRHFEYRSLLIESCQRESIDGFALYDPEIRISVKIPKANRIADFFSPFLGAYSYFPSIDRLLDDDSKALEKVSEDPKLLEFAEDQVDRIHFLLKKLLYNRAMSPEMIRELPRPEFDRMLYQYRYEKTSY